VLGAFPGRSSSWGGPTPHPVLAGGASLVIPGWGQILNGDSRRAAFFLAGTWTAATMWILASSRVEQFLGSAGLVLPYAVEQTCSATARWSTTVTLWVLAVYDAAGSAAQKR
jgi:hypothetical protein